ncbi:NAD(P)H-hydrate dehydratase [Emcibacter sp. SYSU 3D8]|uniref:NAD(P)H-hydrate dehydratase n=1 Tax=Emcibacter sp. SYSU 3D8 TaxID=3133969 RepID=UPI0031FE4656
MTGLDVLTTAEMYRADALAIAHGTPGITLMENAGRACARVIADNYERVPVSVLCGPGNNGGDGFVIARLLQRQGWSVRLGLLGEPARLKGDAAGMASRWTGPVEALSPDLLAGAGLIVDALFGAGLDRPIAGAAADMIEAVNGAGVPVIAIDVPSGVEGSTGRVLGPAIAATRSITFFRKKPAHLLAPSKFLCGHVDSCDIGIPAEVLAEIGARCWENGPALWRPVFPFPADEGHKYARGHAIVVSGPLANGGAARLGARAALRVGAGLVTVACPPDAVVAHASQLNAVMTAPFTDFADILADRRRNAVLVGPGNGVGETTRASALKALRAGRSCVVDADAITSFRDTPAELFGAIAAPCVLTPHDGEFARLFPDITGGCKLDRARAAAARAGAVVLFKGPDTVIAAPDGRAVINANGPPTLATAGSGDVLAGLIVGLLAQSMPAFEAACAGAWLHGRAAALFGPGLIAEDLSETLPAVLRELALL